MSEMPAGEVIEKLLGQHGMILVNKAEYERLRDTYMPPSGGWTCFHCGETFTTRGSARDHFGGSIEAEPGCIIRVQLGDERGLQHALRQAEDQLARYRAEDSDTDRAMHAMRDDHQRALRREEEKGYARGLADGRSYKAPVEVGTCQICGCTDDHACPDRCCWLSAEHDLCSSCFTPIIWDAERDEMGRKTGVYVWLHDNFGSWNTADLLPRVPA